MVRSKHHIVFVSPLPPPVGGIATWTETMRIRGLGRDWHISIVDTRMNGRSVADLSTKWNTELLRTLGIVGRLLRSLVFNRPDIVHINCSLSEKGVFRDAIATVMTRLFRVPVVSHLHGNFLPGERTAFSRWTRAAYRFIFQHSERIVVLNTVSKAGVCRLGNFASSTSVMPNFLDLSVIPEKVESVCKRFNVAYIGTLIKSKGLATILESAEQLPNINFILVGDSDRTGESSHIVDKANAFPNVEFRGALPQPLALAILAESDALIFPSHSEGFPNVVAEAMAIGLPVVASPVGAIPEMIDEPAGGYLIPQDEVARYVLAIETLASDPQLGFGMGKHNQNKARAHYGYEDVIERWREIYKSII
jgi:glycosyltransferase involved in cell wall biosynthesis